VDNAVDIGFTLGLGLAAGLLLAGLFAAWRYGFLASALGALARHLTESDPQRFQPANINYGLFPPLEPEPKKRQRRAELAARAGQALAEWRTRCAA